MFYTRSGGPKTMFLYQIRMYQKQVFIPDQGFPSQFFKPDLEIPKPGFKPDQGVPKPGFYTRSESLKARFLYQIRESQNLEVLSLKIIS